MRWEQWRAYYRLILHDFGFSEREDEQSARVLANLLESKQRVRVEELERLLNEKHVYIFGAGRVLSEWLERNNPSPPLIAAGSATSTLLNHQIIPEIIVTDLDGRVEDQVYANARGAIVVIHAHGDNIDALNRWVKRFKGKLIGTTQARPVATIHNFGGFTDGDRAVFLAHHFRARKITLVGFDFEAVGFYSQNREIKLRKLKWARKLIQELKSAGLLNVKFT